MPCPFRVGDTLVGIHVPGHTDYPITGPGCVVKILKIYNLNGDENALIGVEVVDNCLVAKGTTFLVEPKYFELLSEPISDEEFEKFLCMEVLPT